jgi:DNA-binding XRE family transcriptional regulator
MTFIILFIGVKVSFCYLQIIFQAASTSGSHPLEMQLFWNLGEGEMALESARKYLVRKVGQRLQAKRLGNSYSIDQVTTDIGISPDLLRKIENGSYDISLFLLLDLCRYYKVRAYDLLDNL